MRRRRLVVHALASDRPGDDLHRTRLVVAPAAGLDALHAAAAGRKHGRVPAEQPLLCQQLAVLLGGVGHLFNDALDVPVGSGQTADVHAEAARDGGADLFAVEDFALDFARLEDFLGKVLESRLAAQGKAQGLHAADQPALAMAHRRQAVGQAVLIPAEFGPIGQLVDISRHSPHSLRRIWPLFAARARAFTAYSAEKRCVNHRMPAAEPAAWGQLSSAVPASTSLSFGRSASPTSSRPARSGSS